MRPSLLNSFAGSAVTPARDADCNRKFIRRSVWRCRELGQESLLFKQLEGPMLQACVHVRPVKMNAWPFQNFSTENDKTRQSMAHWRWVNQH